MTENSQRPDCFDFAMDFLGDPEASEILTYVEELESRVALHEPELATKEEIEQREAERQREWRESCKAWDIAKLKGLQALYPDVQ